MKRKRDISLHVEDGGSAKRVRVDFKLNTGIAKLKHALKVARGFEGQKTGKRKRKFASEGNQDAVLRIDAEAEALKTLNLDACAKHHLYKTLSKHKAVAQNPDLPDYVKNVASFTQDRALLNVIARLCNANPVQDALETAVTEVLRALGIRSDDVKVNKKKRLRAKDYSGADGSVAAGKTSGKAALSQIAAHASGTMNDDLQADSDEDSEDDAEFDARLASNSSDDEHDAESVSGLEQRLLAEGIAKQRSTGSAARYDIKADLSLSESEEEAGSSASESRTRRQAPPKSSSFVPTLTSGYIDGSGSDIEDFDNIQRNERRNRRGQRARQKIFEQKYGANAKHLQKKKSNAGWDSKRGAVASNDHRGGRRRDAEALRKPVSASTGRQDARDAKRTTQPRKNDDSGPLHPSWEAAKKAKEQKAVPVKFEGKKITFD